MLFQYALWLAAAVCILAFITTWLWLRSGAPIELKKLLAAKRGLLIMAGALFSFITLVGVAAAAWGMDTSLRWGVGVYPYVLLVLALPTFMLLWIASVRALSRVLWAITIVFPFTFCLADRADRLSKGWALLSDPGDLLRTFFNAFTLVMIPAAILVQLAAKCENRINAEAGRQPAGVRPTMR